MTASTRIRFSVHTGGSCLEGGLQLLIFRQDAPLISPDHATCRSDLPRERFSPLAQNRPVGPVYECLFIGEERR
jgi:hypothetical protein